MNRNLLHRWRRIGLALAALLSAGVALAAPPNIVLIVSDDQAWTDYGFMGHPQIETPRLDRLASESLTFSRGYVPASLCCPSLATIVTGRFPHEHLITGNDPPNRPGVKSWERTPEFEAGRERMNTHLRRWPTLPRVLAERGYLTLQTGKWWQGHFSEGGFTHGMTKGARHGDEGLEIGRTTMQPIYDFIGEARRQQKPFLVWYAPLLPHDPHTPPARLFEKYAKRTPSPHVARYWAMVEWFDETVGALVDHLAEQKLTENTLVVYVTDNGWIQDPNSARYAPRSKQSPYDGGLRTPVMLRWPGTIAPRFAADLVSSVDLFPTVLAAAGAPLPAGLPGVNLLDGRALAGRDTIHGECFLHTARDLDDPAANLRWRWIIAGEWKLIEPAAWNEPDQRPQLFHLGADPFEQTDLSATQPARVQQLRAQLDRWWSPRPRS